MSTKHSNFHAIKFESIIHSAIYECLKCDSDILSDKDFTNINNNIRHFVSDIESTIDNSVRKPTFLQEIENIHKSKNYS